MRQLRLHRGGDRRSSAGRRRRWFAGVVGAFAAFALVPAVAQAATCTAGSDFFLGASVDRERWSTILRETHPETMKIEGANLLMRAQPGDFSAPTTASARNGLLQPAPSGPFTATTRLDVRARPSPQSTSVRTS